MTDRLLYDDHDSIRVTLEGWRIVVATADTSFVFPWNEVACALAKVHVEGTCDRCRQPIADYAPPDGIATAGYYSLGGWARCMDDREQAVCDRCMWDDPRYIAIYGKVQG